MTQENNATPEELTGATSVPEWAAGTIAQRGEPKTWGDDLWDLYRDGDHVGCMYDDGDGYRFVVGIDCENLAGDNAIKVDD